MATGIPRGATPTHYFTADIDLSGAEVLYITYNQFGATVLEKDIGDVVIEPVVSGNVTTSRIEVTLTQEDTLLFKEGTVEMQIRARMPDGTALKCGIMRTDADKLLKGGVI